MAMRADPDDLAARVHAIRLALLCDPSPHAALLADVLLDHARDVLNAEPVDYQRLTGLGRTVLRCETALGLLTLAG
jgi:hypothetical protein